jgi:hypothetical protein
METQTSMVAQRTRVRSRVAGSWWRAGVCAAVVCISAAPALAALTPELPSASARPSSGEQRPTLPSERPSAHVLDPSMPREPSPVGIELPDEVTADELKGAYGLGLGLLILGGIVTAGALIALLTQLVRRTWSEQT